MTIELEKPLYRELTAFQRGDATAAGRAYTLLINHPANTLRQLMPALRSMLKLQNEDLQVLAAVKLTGLGEEASPALDDLKQLALKMIKPQSLAAIHALGSIPGEESLKGLIEVAQAWTTNPEMHEEIIHHLIPTFACHGEAMRPFLRSFQAAIAPCFSSADRLIAELSRTELQRAYYRLGLINKWDNVEPKLPASPALEKRGELLVPTPERLTPTAGIVLKRTITAILDEDPVSVDVEIHHPTVGPELTKPVVALTFESGPAEWTFEETFVMLASLIRAKFDLPAEDTVWLDHNPPHSQRNAFPYPETWRVDMVFFDDYGRYNLPTLSPVRSILAVVREARG